MAVMLVLRALGLGDLLTAVPALRALRRARPDDRILLAAPEPLAPLVRLLDAEVELLPTAGLSALPAVPPVDLAVNLHGSGPESIADLRGTRPRRLLTHRHPDHPDLDGPEWKRDQHEVARWCGLLAYAGVPADPTDLTLRRPATPSPAPGAVIVHPGAASAARRWPPQRFAAVARALADDLAGTSARVLVTGSAEERALATAVATDAGLGPEAVFAGHDLAELAALVAGARLVVCGDTGVGHLATAFETPSVLLFGPTPPSRWGPPADRPRHVVLWAGTVGDPHASTPDPGLVRIATPTVVDAARTLLAGGAPCRTARTTQTASPSVSSAPATSD
ncbi:glycosyltransferase family 9 protein [Saccharomonospora azurea]|nr:glycosyltransferase family 9 protein [Saccharomonospora azurea]